MRTTAIVVSTMIGALVGVVMGYGMAGIGGAILVAVLWGFGGWLVGRVIVSTGTLLLRFWQVGLAVALFISAILLTWGVRV